MRRGFTLVETLVSLATVAVIAGAIMSVMVVASRAMPQAGDLVASTNEASRLLSRLAAEIAPAPTIVESGKSAVEFITPDADGDGAPDTIRYEWDGARGGDLVRTFNGKATVAASGVTAFEAAWFTRDSTIAGAGTPAPGSETTLAAFDDASASTVSITTVKWHAQYVLPVLPAAATGYTVTRAGVTLSRETAIAVTYTIDIRPDASGKPGATTLASATATANAAKNAQQTITATFSNPPTLPPGTGFWIVLRVGVALGSDKALTKSKVADGRQQYAATSDAGLTWSVTTDSSLVFQAYGTVVRAQDLGVSRLDAVEFALQLGADPRSRARRGVTLPAFPPAPSAPAVDVPPKPTDLSVVSVVLDLLDRNP